MQFIETKLPGVFIVEPDKKQDHRGFFARIWCQQEFAEHGIEFNILQSSVSYSPRKGTLRGLHYQAPPSKECKLLRCTQGSMYCALVDMRPESSTYTGHMSVVLSSDNYKTLYVPSGVANGFQTLVDDTEVQYQMSEMYNPEYARGLRWNDPAFGIEWPEADRIILERDDQLADYGPDNLLGAALE